MADGSTPAREEDQAAKIEQYLRVVETRILRALSSDAVLQSCSATLLLIFAAVDALGKLTHPSNKAGAGKRFKYFLALLGTEYERRAEELWKLRNALVHNAINVESYLSSVEIEEWAHLQVVGGTRLIYVNTRLFSADLKDAFNRVKALLTGDSKARRLAAARLKWVDNMPEGVGDQPIPTPPPPVKFIVGP